jgi:hypothetical protein
MKDLRCSISWHDWLYSRIDHPCKRYCQRKGCDAVQVYIGGMWIDFEQPTGEERNNAIQKR